MCHEGALRELTDGRTLRRNVSKADAQYLGNRLREGQERFFSQCHKKNANQKQSRGKSLGEREENLIETVTADNKKANTVVYTVAEEWLNRITHVIGGIISIAGAVFLLIKVFSSQINGVQKAVCVLFAFSMIAFFTFSVMHHFQPVGYCYKQYSLHTTHSFRQIYNLFSDNALQPL